MKSTSFPVQVLHYKLVLFIKLYIALIKTQYNVHKQGYHNIHVYFTNLVYAVS